jgi:hypothetical protein
MDETAKATLHVDVLFAVMAAITVEQAEAQIENYLSMPFYVRCNPSHPADYYVDPYRDVQRPCELIPSPALY